MSGRHICIHGHFYQPPRENPWLEDVEVQDSAHPFHNWNERITFECYAPNTASRLLDDKGRIVDIADNYRYIGFNFGPTLLSWMERRAPDVHNKIVAADRASALDRGGHGNALAQVYNHIIMPLASRRDKVTQVRWGIADFKKRFGRDPEGMWLAETAVDTETLEILADHGIKFTILSPAQALRVRPAGGEWSDVAGGRVDPSRAYNWTSPKGKTLALFFYDAPISRAVAFEGVLNSGESFAARLLSGFSPDRNHAQLVNIATDGESYGHHHRFGDMALAYALRKIQSEGAATLTNHGEYLEKFPPDHDAEIVENSSWSCAHGVERWNADCGCRIGRDPSWKQAWRGPLRKALDRLRDGLDLIFEREAKKFLKDPWAARDAYIRVVLDRGAAEEFFEVHRARPLTREDRTSALKLLELQRQRMLMFTSCAWFFDEISGIETVAVLQFAARALQLADGQPEAPALEAAFLEGLALAPSNVAEFKDGREVFHRFVRPVVTDLRRVAAHEAIEALFEEGPAETSLYAFRVKHLERARLTSDGNTLAYGRVRVASSITEESMETSYAALHLGGHDIHCVLRDFPDPARVGEVRDSLLGRFTHGSLTEVLALLYRSFEERAYTLHDLLLEERRRILGKLITDVIRVYDPIYRSLIEENRKLIYMLKTADMPIPEAFRLAMQYVLSGDLDRCLASFRGDDDAARRLLDIRQEADRFGISLDWERVARLLRHRMEDHLQSLADGFAPDRARHILDLLNLCDTMRLAPNLWRMENLFLDLARGPFKALDGEDLVLASALALRLRFPPLTRAAQPV